MADVKLTVGVEYSPSLVNFQDAIGKIAKSVNSNPPKIKVQLDTNSARTELAKLQNQIKALGNQKIKIEAVTSNKNTGNDSAKNESTKKLTSDTTAYNKALKSVNDLLIQLNKNQERWSQAGSGTSSAAYNDYVKQISAAESLKSSLESGNLTGKQFNETLTQIKASASEAAKSINFAGEDTKALENLTAGTKEYNDALMKIATLREKIQTNLSKWSAAEKGTSSNEYNSLKQQVTELDNLEAKIKSLNATRPEFANQFSAISQAASDASIKIKQAGEDTILLIKDTQQYNDAMAKITNARADIQQKLKDWTAAKNGKSSESYEALKSADKAYKDLGDRLESGAMKANEFNNSFSNVSATVNQASSEIRSAGENTLSLGDKLTNVTKFAAQFVSATRIIYAAIRTFKDMARTSIEIESAMNRIQIVTGATDSQMENFFAEATSRAKELGTSITDIAGSIETFSRLGYQLEDASELAKYATIMSNVADVDVETATTGITSIIKGFDMDVSNAEHVSDVLVEVGQKYAISAEELMQAFERGGASMNASNTSFEKTAALFAATNASLQNAAKTGTVWNTVSARIRSATKELEEMGESTEDLAGGFSKYRDELLARTGVDIQDASGRYRDLYDIFVDIAKVWDTLADDQSKARVGEILGGTRNQAAIMSTITNIKDAISAYDSAMNSAGVSTEANNKYMETTAAHIGQLKASFQELSSDVFDSNVMKVFVDGLRGIVEIIDFLIDHIGILGVIGATAAVTLVAKLGGIVPAISLITTSIERAIITAGGLSNALAVALPFAGLIAFAGAIAYVATSFDRVKDSATEAIGEYEQTKGRLETVNQELETTRSKLEGLEGRTLKAVDPEEYERLVQYNNELEREQRILEHAAAIDKKQAASQANDVLTHYQRWSSDTTNPDAFGVDTSYREGTIIDKINDYTDRINKKREEYNNISNSLDTKTKELDVAEANNDKKTAKSLEKEIESLEKYRDKVDSAISNLESERQKDIDDTSEFFNALKDVEGYEDVFNAYDDALNRVDESIGIVSDSTSNMAGESGAAAIEIESLSTTFDRTKDSAEKYSKTLSSLQSALNEQGTGKSLSLEAFNSDELKEYKSALEYTNGTLQYNLDKVNEITAAKAEEEKATISANKAQAQSKYLENAKEIDELRESLETYKDMSQDERSAIENNIQSLLNENSTIVDNCAAYDLMTASINEATSAYQNWINAQSASETGDMFDSAKTAFQKIDEVLTGNTTKKNTKDKEVSENYGKVGRKDYQAAIDFVVPETIDRDDADAVESYIESISSYFTYDSTGSMSGLNIDTFLDNAVKEGLMTVEGDDYKVAGQKTMQDFADGLGLSLPLVQAIFGELQEYDFEFSWADEAPKTLGDMAVEAREASEALRSMEEHSDIKLVMDVSKFEDTSKAIEALEDNIEQMNKLKATVPVDSSEVEYANSIIQYCIAQKQTLSAPLVMSVDTSQVSGAIGDALSLMQQFQETQNTKELMTSVNAEADTSQVDAAISDITEKINNLPQDVKTNVGINVEGEASITDIQNAINSITSSDQLVKIGVDTSAIDGYLPENKDADAVYGVDDSAVKQYKAPDKNAIVTYDVNHKAVDAYNPNNLNRTVTYTYKTVGSPPSGGNGVNGTAHASGTAAASGNWGTAAGGTTLVGELGREIVVDPRTGKWYTVGDTGAEFVNIPRGAIVFNHLQTEDLLEDGYAIGRASALASGTALVTGGGKKPKYRKSSGSRSSDSGGRKSSSSKKKSSSSKKKSSSKKSSSSKDTDETLKNFKEWLSKLFDWIEIRIKRVQDKIDKYVNDAKWAEQSGFYGTAADNYRGAINTTATLITNQKDARDRYNVQAERTLSKAISSGLISRDQASTIRKKVANGTIEISEYNERMQEVVKSYQSWYDKAKTASNAISELHQKIRDYINDLKAVRDAQRKATIERINNNVSIGTGGTNYMPGIANNQLRYQNVQLENQNSAYSYEVSAFSNDILKLASGAAGSINGILKGKGLSKIKNKNNREAYKKALKQAKTLMWSQEIVPDSILNTIKKYSLEIYNKIYAYNLAIGKLEEARMEQALNYSDTSAEIYKNIAETYKNTDDKTNSTIDLIDARISNATSASEKNAYIDKQIAQYNQLLVNDDKEIQEYESLRRTSASTISSSNAITSRLSSLSASARSNYQRIIDSVRATVRAGNYISASMLASLADMYSKGYITAAFYQACIDYNNALDSKNNAIAQKEIDAETVKQQKLALGQEKFTNIENEYETKRSAIDASSSYIGAIQSTKTTRGAKLTASDYKSLIDNSKKQQELYLQEINSLQNVIRSNLANGYWTTSSQEYKEALISLENYKTSMQECITTQEEYNNSIAQIPLDTIEAALDLLDSIADYNKSVSDLKTAMGKDLAESDYLDQITDNTNKIKKHSEERAKVYSYYLSALASSDKVFGGKTADEWMQMYNSIGATINGLKADNEALKDSMRDDVYWRSFERAHDAANRLHDVLSGIADLIDEDMYYDENGDLTSYGISQVANLVKEYENARTEVQNYSNDIANLNSLYKDGQYTTEEYKQKLAELQKNLLESAGDMKGYLEDIKDIYKDLDKSELDALYKLIDARNKALDAKKEYYDYDKTIREKTEDIQELTAQIAALDGISTAEAKAKRAKLEEQLTKAQEDLEETQGDHFLSLSKDALSDLKTTLDEEFDNKWESLSRDLDKLAELLNDANTLSQNNTAVVSETLNSLLRFYGVNPDTTGIKTRYATGIKRVNGNVVGLSNEAGSELVVTKYGIISRFNPGDGVVPADMTARLYELAQSIKPNSSFGKSSIKDFSGSLNSVEIQQSYGSLINVEGNADAVTVSDLRRLSKDILERSYDYTTSRIKQDYVKTGGIRKV